MKPRGLNQLVFNRETLKAEVRHIDYEIIERDGKRYAYPVGISHDGDNGTVGMEERLPLEHVPCSNCGVYGLVKMIAIGEYRCANCGNVEILCPKTRLHIREGQDDTR